jgi:hypothetical protein
MIEHVILSQVWSLLWESPLAVQYLLAGNEIGIDMYMHN